MEKERYEGELSDAAARILLFYSKDEANGLTIGLQILQGQPVRGTISGHRLTIR